MTIWHCGLSKWYIYMQQLHSSLFETFFYLLKKNNLKAIKENNAEEMHSNGVFMYLVCYLDNFKTEQNFKNMKFCKKKKHFKFIVQSRISLIKIQNFMIRPSKSTLSISLISLSISTQYTGVVTLLKPYMYPIKTFKP